MSTFLTKILVNTVAILFAAYLIKGIEVASVPTAAAVALVLGLLNAFVKPILIILTIPITIFTLGLFLLVINILMVKWVADIVPGFQVSSWWSALWFSIIVSIVGSIIQGFVDGGKKQNKT